MTSEYHIVVSNALGVKVADIVDYLDIEIAHEVNQPGIAKFRLLGNNPAIDSFEHNGIVEIYRRNTASGIAWYTEFVGLLSSQERKYTDRDIYTALCLDPKIMLSWRIVAYYAGSANRSTFNLQPAETIAKFLVTYNATSAALTTDGRLRNGAITGVTSSATASLGTALNWNCAFDNLLETLIKLSKAGAGDFDLVHTTANNFEFRWYDGQLGTDRTSSVVFSLEYGNMANPSYLYDRRDERTVAITTGQGTGSSRQYAIVLGDDYSGVNDYELHVDAKGYQTTTVSAFTAKGSSVLEKIRIQPVINFDVIQSAGIRYGRDYFLGDLVSWRYSNLSGTRKINRVQIQFGQDGNERISIGLDNVR